MSERRAKARRRAEGRPPRRSAPSPGPAQDEINALMGEITRVLAELGEGWGSILLGALTSHMFDAMPGLPAGRPTFRETIREVTVPMLLDQPPVIQRRTVTYLRGLVDANISRPDGLPSNAPSLSDSAEVVLMILREDPRTRHLTEAA